MTVPDWQLPPGVDRGLWDYLHSHEMVRGYDAQINASPLAQADISVCESAFPTPGHVLDLGCGTGRLCLHFARRGFECVGVDLSHEMLAKARENALAAGVEVEWLEANLVGAIDLPASSFDYAACLFSTLGMIRDESNREKVLANAARLLKPGGWLVLHIHNRWFPGLGFRRLVRTAIRHMLGRSNSGDMSMPQAYGGAPLTLHHFTLGEAKKILQKMGFQIIETKRIGLSRRGELKTLRSFSGWRAYGFLLLCERTACH
jgi:SAM-dependent methyltransferase